MFSDTDDPPPTFLDALPLLSTVPGFLAVFGVLDGLCVATRTSVLLATDDSSDSGVLSAALAPFAPAPWVVHGPDGLHLVEEAKAEAAQAFGRMSAFQGQMGMFVRAYAYMRSHGADGLRQVSEDAVLNANYVLRSLDDVLEAPFGTSGPCMHEALFSDDGLPEGFSTLDIAKGLIDEGYHPISSLMVFADVGENFRHSLVALRGWSERLERVVVEGEGHLGPGLLAEHHDADPVVGPRLHELGHHGLGGLEQGPVLLRRLEQSGSCDAHGDVDGAVGVDAHEQRRHEPHDDLGAEAAPDVLADRDVVADGRRGEDVVERDAGEALRRDDARARAAAEHSQRARPRGPCARESGQGHLRLGRHRLAG